MKEFITQLCIVVGIGIVVIASGVIVALLLDKIYIKIMELREDRKNKKELKKCKKKRAEEESSD